MYAPSMGRFLTRDTWRGLPTSPISYNKWVYANSNPLYYTDASGNFPIPLLVFLLGLGITMFGTSGCSTGPEPDVCPSLPPSLQPNALRDNPKEISLANIKNEFGIQLPPPVTYVDQNGVSHSTSYRFGYSSAYTVSSPTTFIPVGYTPWFNHDEKVGTWGDVLIFESAFQRYGNNAFDIAHVMVHEAYHAWQQYTLVQLVQNPGTRFAQYEENLSYYTKQWGDNYSAVMEYEAASYTLKEKTPMPLCTRKSIRDNEQRYLNQNREFTLVPGLEMSPWPMAGYPLP